MISLRLRVAFIFTHMPRVSLRVRLRVRVRVRPRLRVRLRIRLKVRLIVSGSGLGAWPHTLDCV